MHLQYLLGTSTLHRTQYATPIRRVRHHPGSSGDCRHAALPAIDPAVVHAMARIRDSVGVEMALRFAPVPGPSWLRKDSPSEQRAPHHYHRQSYLLCRRYAILWSGAGAETSLCIFTRSAVSLRAPRSTCPSLFLQYSLQTLARVRLY